MKSFREYLVEGQTSLTLYTRCNYEKLKALSNFNYKNKVHVHFEDYDGGMYSFLTPGSALKGKSYGEYILKFRIPGGVRNFFFTSFKHYKTYVNPNARDGVYADEIPFIDEQLKNFRISKSALLKQGIYPAAMYNEEGNKKYKERNGFKGVENFRGFVKYLERDSNFNNKIKGVEYYSGADKECFLVFNNTAIVPETVYGDDGKFKGKINKTLKHQGYKNSRSNLNIDKEKNFKTLDDFNGYTGDVIKDKRYYNVWLNGRKIPNLKKAPQYVEGTYSCENCGLLSLEGAPEKVGKSFDCSNNNLTSLEGSPRYVGKDFVCFLNRLTTLKGAPKHIGQDFYCSNNQLTSLKGSPEKIDRHFDCDHNNLTALNGGPKEVGGRYDCSDNNLTSLGGAPKKINDDFNCSGNRLTTLKGAPEYVRGDFYCDHNNLTTLKGGPQEVGGVFYCYGNPGLSKDYLLWYSRPKITPQEWAAFKQKSHSITFVTDYGTIRDGKIIEKPDEGELEE